ncbi:MAG: pepP [Gammaproteobacteria bacterium]|jgi:Xaa-Pro aminopeptidase|nr:pepP [Gammaproteobacteria bacterium]
MITMAEFARRRKQLMQHVGSTGIVILTAAPVASRNGESDYPYRQHSDFYYLTGFDEPEAVAILAPKNKGGEFILFNRARNQTEEIWTGTRAGQAGACKKFGADKAYPISELADKLPELLAGRAEIHYTLGANHTFDALLLEAIQKIRGKIRNGTQSPFGFIDLASTVHEMRVIKSPAEINLMRKAAEISALAHRHAMAVCKPGMNEYQLEAEITYLFQRNGGRYSAYIPIVGSGANSCILHYTNNNHVIAKDSLVLVDAGCEYQYYASDVTRTFPANGKFSAEQRAIYEIVLAAQLAGIQAVRPNAEWCAPQKAIVKIITQGLLDLGLLKGSLQNLLEAQAYMPFYMHSSGHWLGLDVHDVGRYKSQNKWRRFQPGMVLTVEPGIYISAKMPTIAKRWHNIGVRIEDDILVTATGNDVLSAGAPKTIQAIEEIMQ